MARRIRNPFYAHTLGQRNALAYGGFSPPARSPSRSSGSAPGGSPAPSLPRPPVGTYDPSIDATERAAVRGYSDLKADSALAGTRAQNDFNISLADLGRVRDYGIADIGRNVQRGTEDFTRQFEQLGTNRTRLGEDHNAALAGLQRRYDLLGGNQRQSINAAGLTRGGALQQALAKRQANQAIDQQPIDTGYQRGVADLNTQESGLKLAQARAGEDAASQGFRLTQQYGTGESSYQGGNAWADAWLKQNPGKQLPGTTDYGFEGQRAALGYQRGAEDRSTQVRRGGRELNAYGQDLIPVRFYSAAGLSPYTAPKRRRR